MNDFLTKYSLSLRQFLALPFLALLVLIGITVSWIFYENSLRSSHRMEQQLALSLNTKVNQHLGKLFAEPVRAVNAAHQLYRSERLLAPEPIDRARQFATIMDTAPELTSLNFGFEDGRQFGVTRNLNDSADAANAALHASIIASGTKPYRNVYALRELNQRDQFLFEDTATYVPNTNAWYRSAVDSGKAGWYPLYRYPAGEIAEASGNFGIDYAMPEFDDQNHVIGVIHADIAIGQISRYLKSLALGDGDVVLIVDEHNQIVGISNDLPLMRHEQVRQNEPGKTQLIRFDNIDSPLIKAAGQHLPKQGTGSSFLTIQGASYVEDLREFQSGTGLTLRTLVLVPNSQFAAIALAEFKSMLYQLWIAIAIGMALVLLMAIRLGRPIAELSAWTLRLSSGDEDALKNANNAAQKLNPVRELRQLGESISTMATSLHETVTTLEERVAERTAELELVNSNLFELSNTDGLTGIPNRRKFDEVLNSEWNRATRSGQPLALALIDVDWFKKYNDHYGHLAGDDCLRNMANVLKSKIRRSSDLVARYGGEEFAIISPGINKINASEMANLICLAVADAKLPHTMSPFGKVTVSIGVAMIVPALDVAPETLIKAADEALYHAKDNGRNQVISAEIEIANKEKYSGSEFRFEQI